MTLSQNTSHSSDIDKTRYCVQFTGFDAAFEEELDMRVAYTTTKAAAEQLKIDLEKWLNQNRYEFDLGMVDLWVTEYHEPIVDESLATIKHRMVTYFEDDTVTEAN